MGEEASSKIGTLENRQISMETAEFGWKCLEFPQQRQCSDPNLSQKAMKVGKAMGVVSLEAKVSSAVVVGVAAGEAAGTHRLQQFQ